MSISIRKIWLVIIDEQMMTLTLSSLQSNVDTFVNSVDPNEMAHNEPSHQDLNCLAFLY